MRGRNSAGVEFHALLRAHQISSMNRFSRQDIVRRREPGMCGPACLDTRYEFGAEAGGIILHDVSAASAAIPAPRMAQNGHLVGASQDADIAKRSEEHTSELQSLMRISYAVFCLKKKNHNKTTTETHTITQ